MGVDVQRDGGVCVSQTLGDDVHGHGFLEKMACVSVAEVVEPGTHTCPSCPPSIYAGKLSERPGCAVGSADDEVLILVGGADKKLLLILYLSLIHI